MAPNKRANSFLRKKLFITLTNRASPISARSSTTYFFPRCQTVRFRSQDQEDSPQSRRMPEYARVVEDLVAKLESEPKLVIGGCEMTFEPYDLDDFQVDKAERELRETPELMQESLKVLCDMLAGQDSVFSSLSSFPWSSLCAFVWAGALSFPRLSVGMRTRRSTARVCWLLVSRCGQDFFAGVELNMLRWTLIIWELRPTSTYVLKQWLTLSLIHVPEHLIGIIPS